MNANGDGPNPEHLRKLLGQLKGMAKEAKRKVAHRRGRVFAGKATTPKLPRQICDICNVPFDFVIATKPIIPEISRCADCKQKLSEGWTALVGKPKIAGDWLHAFVRSPAFKAGEVISNLSEETMKAVQAKLNQNQ